jgi:hypothetical protein
MPDVYLRSIEPLIAIVLGCMRWKSANRIGTLTAGGDAKHLPRAAPFEPPLAQHCPANSKNDADETAGTTMADRSGLRLVGFIFASVMFAVMLTATMVVKGYSDGVYSLESAAIEGR